MKTSRSRSTLPQRFILTTLLWSLALLLVMNVGWSAWAASCWRRTGFKGFAASKSEVTAASMSERDGFHVRIEATRHEKRTRSIYFVHVLVTDDTSRLQWFILPRQSYADVTPVWLQRETARSVDLSWKWSESQQRVQGWALSQFYWSSGWPSRLLWSGFENSAVQERPVVIAGIPVLLGDSYGLEDIVCLPTSPIGTGQALTGILWLGVVVLIRVLVYLLRYSLSDIRRRRGLCVRSCTGCGDFLWLRSQLLACAAGWLALYVSPSPASTATPSGSASMNLRP